MRPSILVTEVMTVTVGASDSWKPAARPDTHGLRSRSVRPPRFLHSLFPSSAPFPRKIKEKKKE